MKIFSLSGQGYPSWLPQALSFLASSAIMVLELVAGRLVSEHVGSSNYTWISIIVVVLTGMSVGSALGGRLSDRMATGPLLERWFLLAAIAIQLPLFLSPLLRYIKPGALIAVLNHPEGSARSWGLLVLLMMAAVFLVPAVALGALSPIIARLAVQLRGSEGRAVGDVWSWGALGSILAVFGTSYVLVPMFAVSTILWMCSGVMALLSFWLWSFQRLQLSDWSPAVTAAAGPATSPTGAGPDSDLAEPASAAHNGSRMGFLLPAFLYAGSSAALMAVEMVAGRQVTRFVGSSVYTWSTVIGVIFAGMSLGNYLGGRLAERRTGETALRSSASLLLGCAGLAIFSILYTHDILDSVLYRDDWPGGSYQIDARLELPTRALIQLEREGFPAVILSKLREAGLEGGRHLGAFKAELKGVAPELTESQLSLLADRARLGGTGVEQMRGEGVPEPVIDGLRPLIQRTFLRGFADNIKKELYDSKRMEGYSHAERNYFLYQIDRASWMPSIFVFPVRLLVVVSLVYLPVAVSLGMLSPLLTLLALKVGMGRGRVLGSMGAWGAWGSIFGTLLSGFVLIPALGTLLLLQVCAVSLTLLGTLLGPYRRWLALSAAVLSLACLPLLTQRLEPDAMTELRIDPFEEPPAPSDHGPLTQLSERIESGLHVRNTDLGPNAVESAYQYLRVGLGEIEGPPVAHARQLRKLNLDRLIHGYVMYRMPGERGGPFQFALSRFDGTHLEYDYERVYALVVGRAVGARVRSSGVEEGAQPILDAPPLTSLSLGGGTYTFPRYLLENYPGVTVTLQQGETLEGVLSRLYRRHPYADMPELMARVLACQPPGGPQSAAALAPGSSLVVPTLADVAELDPAVTAVNYSRFKLARPQADARIKTWNHDARNVVEAFVQAGWQGRYDIIFGDAFNHYSIPYHLTTREFNAQVKTLLKPGGVFVANVIDNYQKSHFLSAYYTTLSTLYRHVTLIGTREESGRFGRETFIIAASDRPLDLSVLGGLELDGLEALEQGNSAALLQYLSETSNVELGALRQKVFEALAITESGERPQPDILARLLSQNQTDLRLMGLPIRSDELRPLILGDEERATGRLFQAFTPAETDRLVRQGQMLTAAGLVRALLPVRMLLGRPKPAFELTPSTLHRVEAADLPASLVAALQTLKGQRFETPSQLLDALTTSVPLGEVERVQHRFLPLLLERPARRPPLILTDSFAPTEELTSLLFEDAPGK